MKCEKCGTEFESKCCPECGTKAENNKPLSFEETSAAYYDAMKKADNEKKKKKRIGCLSAVAVLVVIIVIFAVISGGKKENNNENNNSNETASSSVSNETEESKKEQTTVSPKKTIEEAKKLAEKKDYAGAIKLLKEVNDNDEADKLLNEYRKTYLKPENFGIYWDEDDMSDYHWALAKGQDYDIHDFSFCLYISQQKANPESIEYYFMSSFTGYVGSKEWIFPYTVRIKGDNGKTLDIPIGDRKSDMDGRAMYEWFNFYITESQFNEICELISNSKKVTLRFSGSKYYDDHELSQKQIDDIKKIYKFSQALKNAY